MALKKRVSKAGKTSYLIQVFQGRDEHGHRREITETYHGNKKQAQAREADIKRHLEQGTWSEPNKMSLATFLNEWLDKSAKIKLKARTYQDYQDIVRRYMKGAIGHLPLVKLTPLHVQGFYNDMTTQGLAPQTVRNIHTVLRGALKMAVRWRYITYNPAMDVDLPRKDQAKVLRSMDPDQARVFVEAVKASRWAKVYTTALVLGARPAEYLALQWTDLDWNEARVEINKTLYRPRGGGWVFATPKTKKSCRTVDIPRQLIEVLRQHRAVQLQERLLAGADWDTEHDFIFANMKGGPLHDNVLSRCFKDVLKSAGLPLNFRLYDLRHTCATMMLLDGESAKVVSERLGHSGVTLTLDTYSHVLASMQKRSTERLGDRLFGAG